MQLEHETPEEKFTEVLDGAGRATLLHPSSWYQVSVGHTNTNVVVGIENL